MWRYIWGASIYLLYRLGQSLTAFCAWDSSPLLTVTPAQLMRPGIDWNASFIVDDVALYSGSCSYSLIVCAHTVGSLFWARCCCTEGICQFLQKDGIRRAGACTGVHEDTETARRQCCLKGNTTTQETGMEFWWVWALGKEGNCECSPFLSAHLLHLIVSTPFC